MRLVLYSCVCSLESNISSQARTIQLKGFFFPISQATRGFQFAFVKVCDAWGAVLKLRALLPSDSGSLMLESDLCPTLGKGSLSPFFLVGAFSSSGSQKLRRGKPSV